MVEVLHQLLGAVLGAREDERQAVRVFRKRLAQDLRLLVLAGNVVDILLHLVGGLAGRGDFHLLRVDEILAGKLGDQLGHGGREEQRLAVLRHHLGNLAQVVDEAEVEHLVGLVEHEVAGLRQRHGLAGDEVEQASGGGDEDVGAAVKHFRLLVDGGAADDGDDAQRRLFHEVAQVVGDLVHEFAGRGEDEGADVARVGAAGVFQKLLDHRQAEGGRLAGAGLGKADQVRAFEDEGNGFFLDRSRFFEAERGKGGDDGLREAEVVESGQVKYLSGRQTRLPGTHHALPVSSGVKNPA